MSIRPVLLYRQTMADKRMIGAREAWRPDRQRKGGADVGAMKARWSAIAHCGFCQSMRSDRRDRLSLRKR